jgi:hypothetical protein
MQGALIEDDCHDAATPTPRPLERAWYYGFRIVWSGWCWPSSCCRSWSSCRCPSTPIQLHALSDVRLLAAMVRGVRHLAGLAPGASSTACIVSPFATVLAMGARHAWPPSAWCAHRVSRQGAAHIGADLANGGAGGHRSGWRCIIVFAPLGLTGSYIGLVLVHAILGVPFVITTVTATLQGFDFNLVRAASSLGANPLSTFFRDHPADGRARR